METTASRHTIRTPYGPVLTSFAFSSNNTALTMNLLGNGTYTQCGTDACGSGTIVKEQVCYNSSCYTGTTTLNYRGSVNLNLNNMSLSGSPFAFTGGYTYKIILTDPDGASYS